MSDFSLLSFLLVRLIWLYDFEAANKACGHFIVLFGLLVYVSINHICLLSCDRYIAIIYPLRYTEIVTRTRVTPALLVAWGVPVVSTVVFLLFYDNGALSRFRTSLIGCSEFTGAPHSLRHKVHLVFNSTLFMVIPFVVMIFIYGHIAQISCFQSNRVEPGENLNPETAELRRTKKKEMKWLKTIGNLSLISPNGTLKFILLLFHVHFWPLYNYSSPNCDLFVVVLTVGNMPAIKCHSLLKVLPE